MVRFSILTLLVLLLTFGFIGGALAQEPTPSDDDVNAIAKQLFCPVCENIPLDVCPTQACEEWRELIREKLAAGWDEDQIKAYFVEQYGARVLGTPPASGFNWLVYLIPPLVIVGGIYVLYRSYQSMKAPQYQKTTQDEVEDEEPADEYVAQLEEELRKR
jgi:cytochrome c-type biogenesis protein CcmH